MALSRFGLKKIEIQVKDQIIQTPNMITDIDSNYLSIIIYLLYLLNIIDEATN